LENLGKFLGRHVDLIGAKELADFFSLAVEDDRVVIRLVVQNEVEPVGVRRKDAELVEPKIAENGERDGRGRAKRENDAQQTAPKADLGTHRPKKRAPHRARRRLVAERVKGTCTVRVTSHLNSWRRRNPGSSKASATSGLAFS